MKKTKSSPAKVAPQAPIPPARTAKAARSSKASPPAALPPEAQLVDDGELDHDVLEFVNAIDAYKRTRGRPFPAWSEVLDVLKGLGYRKGA